VAARVNRSLIAYSSGGSFKPFICSIQRSGGSCEPFFGSIQRSSGSCQPFCNKIFE
jgi:hypothetical protein